MKRILKYWLAVILLGGAAFLIRKCYYSVKEVVLGYQDNVRAVACLYEAMTFKNCLRIDTTEHHVLCIGNSITLHGPMSKVAGADPAWTGNWGMCASLPDSDYVHRLEKKFKSINSKSDITIAHMADWEADQSLSMDSFLKEKIKGKDIIIIRLGENVREKSRYEKGFADLVRYCKNYTSNIIIAGNYWRNSTTESYMIRAARENNIPYVPLYWIMDLYKEKVMFHVGDTIYNMERKPYTIKTDFITTHPNDYGMRLIAEAIWRSIIVEE